MRGVLFWVKYYMPRFDNSDFTSDQGTSNVGKGVQRIVKYALIGRTDRQLLL